MSEMSDFAPAMERSPAIQPTTAEVGTREKLGVSPEEGAKDLVSTEEAR
jgi:hypothetical protein